MLLCSTGQHPAHPAGYSRPSPLVQLFIQVSFNFSWLQPKRIPNEVHTALLSIHQGQVSWGGKPEEQNEHGCEHRRVRGVGVRTGESAGVHTPQTPPELCPSPGTSRSPHSNRCHILTSLPEHHSGNIAKDPRRTTGSLKAIIHLFLLQFLELM